MDLTLLDKASSVTPLIVQLYDNHQLYALARDKNPEARRELTQAIAEILEKNLGASENELIADILIALTRQAEMDLRQAIAERIGGMENVPLRLVLQLANDDIEIAAPVLRASPVLGDLDLVYIIKSRGPKYWQEIAARKSLTAYMINMLAETRDIGTALALAENEVITLTDNALSVLTELAQHSEALADPLLHRPEMKPDLAARLFHFVGEELKTFIKAHFDVEPSDVIKAVDEVIEEMVSGSPNSYMPTDSMLAAAEQQQSKGLLSIELMISCLRRGQIPSFVAQFKAYTGLSLRTVETVLTQNRGQGLAIACRAFDIPKPDFISIFLLTNPMRSSVRIVDLKDMGRAIEYFDRLKPGMARELIKQE
jgi:uncharacterized protein (DUF2336 family)